jgi:hypothetical protein
MLSSLIRATTRAFVRVLVIALVSALMCGFLSLNVLAREIDRTPYELPGDGEDVGGYKDYEFESSPTSGSTLQQGNSLSSVSTQDHQVISRQLVMTLFQFYLISRR